MSGLIEIVFTPELLSRFVAYTVDHLWSNSKWHSAICGLQAYSEQRFSEIHAMQNAEQSRWAPFSQFKVAIQPLKFEYICTHAKMWSQWLAIISKCAMRGSPFWPLELGRRHSRNLAYQNPQSITIRPCDHASWTIA